MNQDQLQSQILSALRRLGVTVAGTHDDRLRWSVTDLAKDLAEILHDKLGGTFVAIAEPATLHPRELRPIVLGDSELTRGNVEWFQ